MHSNLEKEIDLNSTIAFFFPQIGSYRGFFFLLLLDRVVFKGSFITNKVQFKGEQLK